jgi:hypothetical protein
VSILPTLLPAGSFAYGVVTVYAAQQKTNAIVLQTAQRVGIQMRRQRMRVGNIFGAIATYVLLLSLMVAQMEMSVALPDSNVRPPSITKENSLPQRSFGLF